MTINLRSEGQTEREYSRPRGSSQTGLFQNLREGAWGQSAERRTCQYGPKGHRKKHDLSSIFMPLTPAQGLASHKTPREWTRTLSPWWQEKVLRGICWICMMAELGRKPESATSCLRLPLSSLVPRGFQTLPRLHLGPAPPGSSLKCKARKTLCFTHQTLPGQVGRCWGDKWSPCLSGLWERNVYLGHTGHCWSDAALVYVIFSLWLGEIEQLPSITSHLFQRKEKEILQITECLKVSAPKWHGSFLLTFHWPKQGIWWTWSQQDRNVWSSHREKWIIKNNNTSHLTPYPLLTSTYFQLSRQSEL